MHRVIAAGPFAIGSTVAIPDDEAHHLRVRRAGAGEPVEVLDGMGSVAAGKLEAIGKSWTAAIDAVTTSTPPFPLTLIVAAGDKDRFGWLVEKGAELGVTDLIPVETERSRNVATRIRADHVDKLRRRAVEVMKQSGSPWAMRIAEVVELRNAIGTHQAPVKWLADAAGRSSESARLDGPVIVAVGPEGGFAPAERELLIGAGYLAIRLAQHTLRFETAALAAAAAVNHERARGS